MPNWPGEREQDDIGATWRTLVELFLAQRERFLHTATELGLTPAHAHALHALVEQGPDAPPMRGLARVLECDASNVTGIVDRLEARGYVERRVSPSDRRVKTLVVTEAGLAAHDRLRAMLYEPPAAFGGLSPSDRATLRRIVEQLTTS